MVAAWISALTGVGPSIASGNQTCSGNWADLPMDPQKISTAVNVATEIPRIVIVCNPSSTSGVNRALKVRPAWPWVRIAAEA